MIRSIQITVGQLFGCLFLFVAVAPLHGAETQEEQFQDLVNSSKADYQELRDHFIDKANLDFLRQKLASADTSDNEWVAASILLGWINNEKRYRQLLDTEPKMDRSRQSYYPWARQRLLSKNEVPLLIEMMYKGGGHGDAARDAEFSLNKLLRSGATIDPRFLTVPFENGRPSQRDRFASLMSILPPSRNPKLLDKLSELYADEEDKNVAIHLLAGMARQSKPLANDDQRKKKTVDILTDDLTVDRFGSHAVYSNLAEIGGERSESVILQHLADVAAGDDIDKKIDAIEIAVKLNSKQVSPKLVQIAKDKNSPDHLKALIHNNLPSIPHDQAVVGNYFLSIIKQDDSAAIKETAIDGLNKIHDSMKAEGKDAKFISNDIESLILNGNLDPTTTKKLQNAFDDMLLRGRNQK